MGSSPDPRVARTKAHVLAVAGELLASEGREGFSVESVARASGVARTTIYRHWPELADLLADTFSAMSTGMPGPVDTGSVRDDLVALYVGLNDGFGRSCLGRALPAMLDITRRDDTLRPFHAAFIAERRRPSVAAVRRGVERGELPGDVDPERLVDRIAGPIFYRQLVVRDPYSTREVERLVDEVLAGSLPTKRARAGKTR